MATKSTSAEVATQPENATPLKAGDMSPGDVEFMLACMRCFDSDGIVSRLSLFPPSFRLFDQPVYQQLILCFFQINLTRLSHMVGHGAVKSTRNKVWAIKLKYGISYLPTRSGTVSSPGPNNTHPAKNVKGTSKVANDADPIAGVDATEPDTPCPKTKGRKRATADEGKSPKKKRRQGESGAVNIAKAAEEFLNSLETSQKK